MMSKIEQSFENENKLVSVNNVFESITKGNEFDWYEDEEKLNLIKEMGYAIDSSKILDVSRKIEGKTINFPDRFANDEKGKLLFNLSTNSYKEIEQYIKPEELQDYLDYILDSSCFDFTNAFKQCVGWEKKSKEFGLYTGAVKKFKEYAEQNNIDLKIDVEKLSQKVCQDFMDIVSTPVSLPWYLMKEGPEYSLRFLIDFAEKYDIKLPFSLNEVEERLNYLLHASFSGHTDGIRSEVKKNLSNPNSYDELYNKYVKGEFRETLNIPKEKWFDRKAEEVLFKDGKQIQVELHGYERNIEGIVEGKYVLGKTKNNTLALVFDGTMGEHMDIKAKYDLDELLGGGWLVINSTNKEKKTVTVTRRSTEYGQEPRIITATIIKKQFPDFEVIVGSLN